VTGGASGTEAVALRLAGYLEAGMEHGFLDGAPDWWVAGIQARLRRLDQVMAGGREPVEQERNEAAGVEGVAR
jgi:hypothetical protein